MQGMTSAICDAVYTPSGAETVVPTATLRDTRDDKTYKVAKLADGKCWMVQNLDLQVEDIKEGVTLSSENTDNPAANFALLASQITVTDDNRQWYAYDDETGELLPSSVDTAHVYDLAGDETEYRYCLDYRGYCAEYGDVIPSELLGNLYNWYSATAGTGTYSTGSTEQGPFEATGSICPAGWRLPKGRAGTTQTATTNEYGQLLYAASVTTSLTGGSYSDTGFFNIRVSPLYLVRGGEIFYDSLNGIGQGRGYYWSSTVYDANETYFMDFSSRFVYPANSYGSRYKGGSVRCLIRQ